jgi:lysozyme family protein
MANFSTAIAKTLTHEGGFMHDRKRGECANFGISHWFLIAIGLLPDTGDKRRHATEADLQFVRSLTQDQAVELYREHFWARRNFHLLKDDDVAAKAFDLTVNMGAGGWARSKSGHLELRRGGIVLLQESVNELRERALIQLDGRIGPATAGAVNTTSSPALLDRLRANAERRYRSIAGDPVQRKNLEGWLNRLAS